MIKGDLMKVFKIECENKHWFITPSMPMMDKQWICPYCLKPTKEYKIINLNELE